MLIHCKNCKNKITISENESSTDGKLITCNICKEEWIHHSKTFFLESRLMELEQNLKREESLILEENLKYSETITLLEKELTNKRGELDKQKTLEKKVFNFETRITDTEKLNLKQADLEAKKFELEKHLKKISDEINNKNQDIEKKTNYLEMKTISMHDINKNINKNVVNGNKNDVVNIKTYEKKDTQLDNKKKRSFFWNTNKD